MIMEKKPKTIAVNDRMQKGYTYLLTEPMGQHFDLEFKPDLTPKQMLEIGIFGGKYMTDCKKEFPADWFEKAKLCHERHNPKLNFFRRERQPAAFRVARERMDPPRGSARLVPMVLPLFHGSPIDRGR